MANPPAIALRLRAGDYRALTDLAGSFGSVDTGLAKRARIVLLAAQGLSNTEIARRVGATRATVITWRTRYVSSGMYGLLNRDRPGRPRRLDSWTIVAATLVPPSEEYRATRWSSRLLAGHLGVGNSTVDRAWREYGIRPWSRRAFQFYTEPSFMTDVAMVAGLFLAGTERAVVLRLKGGTLLRPLGPATGTRPAHPWCAQQRTRDNDRHGLKDLRRALNRATGIGALGRNGFLDFLRQLDHAYPGQELHLVVDNEAVPKDPEVEAWLAAHACFTVHSTQTSRNWLNLLEVWLWLTYNEAPKQCLVTEIKELSEMISQFATDPKVTPFVWITDTD